MHKIGAFGPLQHTSDWRPSPFHPASIEWRLSNSYALMSHIFIAERSWMANISLALTELHLINVERSHAFTAIIKQLEQAWTYIERTRKKYPIILLAVHYIICLPTMWCMGRMYGRLFAAHIFKKTLDVRLLDMCNSRHERLPSYKLPALRLMDLRKYVPVVWIAM